VKKTSISTGIGSLFLCMFPLWALALPAFPGAEGFGARATGGRGGVVLKVTNLNASGKGSLAWAAAQKGKRIIVFDVSGVIKGNVQIAHGDVTIAGQTAPGAGITIQGHLYTPYNRPVSNMIIRHIRVRPPHANAGGWKATSHDAIQFSTANLFILDHVDASHGIDEIVDFWGGAKDITVQWTVLSFPYITGHPKGNGKHHYCLINADGGSNGKKGGNLSLHHTLFAHCIRRTPATSVGPSEVVNNVIYNARESYVHHNQAWGEFNIIGNYYKGGPSVKMNPFWFDPENRGAPTKYFVSNNWIDHPGVFVGRVDNPFQTKGYAKAYPYFYLKGYVSTSNFNYTKPFNFRNQKGYVPITTQDPKTAYSKVLDCSGAWPRDIVTKQAVQETRTRTGKWTSRTLTDLMKGLQAGKPGKDSDGDGMPDSWEAQHKRLNPNKADHNTALASGYTAIETYINQLADKLVGPGCSNKKPPTQEPPVQELPKQEAEPQEKPQKPEPQSEPPPQASEHPNPTEQPSQEQPNPSENQATPEPIPTPETKVEQSSVENNSPSQESATPDASEMTDKVETLTEKEQTTSTGCSCSTNSTSPPWLWGMLLLLLWGGMRRSAL